MDEIITLIEKDESSDTVNSYNDVPVSISPWLRVTAGAMRWLPGPRREVPQGFSPQVRFCGIEPNDWYCPGIDPSRCDGKFPLR